MNVSWFLVGSFLLICSIIALLGNGEAMEKMHRFWNRPRLTGRFAWTDKRPFEPSLPATRIIIRTFAASMAALGLAIIVASIFLLEPASVNVSNVPGLLFGIVLFLAAFFFMFAVKQRLAETITQYWNERRATEQRAITLNVDAVRTALWLVGLAVGAVGLALILVSMKYE